MLRPILEMLGAAAIVLACLFLPAIAGIFLFGG